MNSTDLIISFSVTLCDYSYNFSIYPLQWHVGFASHTSPTRVKSFWMGPLCLSVLVAITANDGEWE